MNLLLTLPHLLAQATDLDTQPDYNGAATAGGIIGGIVGFLVWLVVIVIIFASLWKIAVKAGRQGWEGIVPVYNLWVMAEIAGKPGWMGLLLFVPCLNIIFGIIILIALAQSFGKSAAYGLGLFFLGIIFFPMLAFGDARYVGPGGVPRGTIPPPAV
jgi:hypothetical protein